MTLIGEGLAIARSAGLDLDQVAGRGVRIERQFIRFFRAESLCYRGSFRTGLYDDPDA